MADTASVTAAELARQALRMVELARPDVAALALLASPARKIEPELLRTLRLELSCRLPAASRPHAGTEAALWFSPLVESRGPDSITLLAEVSRELQDRLKAEAGLFEAAHDLIEQLHREISPVLRWEEELVYLALTQTVKEIPRQHRIKDAARQALEAISTNTRIGLEDRVREMWARLPAAATTNAYLANVHHLCDVRALRRAGTRTKNGGSLETILLQVRKTGKTIRIGFLESADLAIRVPAIDPVTLDVLKSERSRRAVSTLVVRSEHWVEVPLGTEPLVLRTIDGQVYSLAPAQFEEAASQATPGGDETQPLNEARLIVLGNPAAGKTALINGLVSRPFSQTESSTHGLVVTNWEVLASDGRRIAVDICDLGGQEVFRQVNDIFATPGNAVYLVVLDRPDDAAYWLKYVSARGNVTTVLALSRADISSWDISVEEIRKKYPVIKAIVSTSAKTGSGIADLRQALTGAIEGVPAVNAAWPARWLAVRRRLRSMKENFVSIAEFRATCAEMGLSEPKSQNSLATLLHDSGAIIYFADDPRLRETVVLHPQWVAVGVARVLVSRPSGRTRGILRSDELGGILASEYPDWQAEFILEMMVKLDLCVRYPGPAAEWLVPELLDAAPPDFGSEFAPGSCLNLRYIYSRWPDAVMARFIVSMESLNAYLPRWRNGVVLQSGSNRALVKADPEKGAVDIAIGGPMESRKPLLENIRSAFESIHGNFADVGVRMVVPLPQDFSSVVEYEVLRKYFEAGKVTADIVQGSHTFTVNVPQLLGEDTGDQLPRGIRPKMFISYAHEDERFLRALSQHLAPLVSAGLVDSWSDRSIAPGDAWEKEIAQQLETADLMVFLISPDFLASDYLSGIEMKRALERHEQGTAWLIPVLVRPCLWQETPFAKIQMLPRGAKPVSSFRDQNAAWVDVAKSIEDVLRRLENPKPGVATA